VRIQGSSPHGSGIRLEINGEKGDLVVQAGPGARGIQMSDLSVFRSSGSAQQELLVIPEEYYGIPGEIRFNPPMNVAKSYQSLAGAIRHGDKVPDFNDALALHKVLDNIMKSSQERCFIK